MRNPKQKGSKIYDCRPQTGKCQRDCNQCFYNHNFYEDIEKPKIPIKIPKGCIVRMNAGHDSNLHKDLVLMTAKKYKDVFFNTSLINFEFPGPVVFTANPNEEKEVRLVRIDLENLMFVRLRVSATNLDHIYNGVEHYCDTYKIPVILTYMNYYDVSKIPNSGVHIYEQKTHVTNTYYSPNEQFKKDTLKVMKTVGGRLVHNCGSSISNLCKDCNLCYYYYFLTKRHMEDIKQRKGE